MRDYTYKCDICDREKKEANKWLIFRTQNDGSITVMPWNETLARKKAWGHLCSDSCMIKKVVRVVRGGKDAHPALIDEEGEEPVDPDTMHFASRENLGMN